ncbi:MAG: hypothetical protein ACRCTZ_15565 [Sarcina sp.]
MNIYDKRINELIKFLTKDKAKISESNIIDKINVIFTEKNIVNKKVAIWGLGDHTDRLYKYFGEFLSGIMYYLDSYKSGEYRGKKICGIKEVNLEEIDLVIISSFEWRNEIKEKLIELGIEYLDIYEELENEDIKMKLPFYTELYDIKAIGYYMKINRAYMNFKENQTYLNLKSIIIAYLEIRDIIFAMKFIEIGLEIFNEDEELNFVKNELIKITSDIKEKIQNRKNKSFLILILDALKYQDVMEKDYMSYLKKFAFENNFVENAYSNSIFTFESLVASFKGEDNFQNNNFEKSKVKADECKFIKVLFDNNDEVDMTLLEYEPIIEFEGARNTTCLSNDLWKYCVRLIEKDDRYAGLLYNMSETHRPFISGFNDIEVDPYIREINEFIIGKNDEIKNQCINSLKYVDDQLKFYFDFLEGEKEDILVFSDHGEIGELYGKDFKEIGYKFVWENEKVKIPVIYKSKIKLTSRIFSLKNIGDLISSISLEKDLEIKEKFIRIQFSGFKNLVFRRVITEAGFGEILDKFEVIVTEKYKIIKTEKEYFKVTNLDDEPIQDENLIRKIKKEWLNEFSF